MKFYKAVKRIFFAVFGRAWYFLIALGVLLTWSVVTIGNEGFTPVFNGLKDYDDRFMKEFVMDDTESFSVNSNGTAVITGNYTPSGEAAVFDFESGETLFSNVNMISSDIFSDDYFMPYNLVVTDDDEIYAVKSYYTDSNSALLESESIVRMSEGYKYIGDVCDIEYDILDRQRESKISRLHYYDGAVTYAVTEKEGVRLYSIDTGSQVLSESGLYPSDPDGTFTVNVIPLDGSFLFLRSDGNVYRTGFDEALGDSICRFDIDAEGLSGNPYFDLAAVVNGTLYVADSWNIAAVYKIENGALVKAFDLEDDYCYIASLDSYRYKDDDKESLVICLDNAVLTYSDGELYDDTPVIRFTPTILMHINNVFESLLIVVIASLVINLIIRKKTLLYKHLIIVLPVLIVLTLIIAHSAYVYSDDKNEERIYKDLNVICDLSKSEFDGFDFTGLMSADKDTGSAYMELIKRFNKLGSGHGHDWSNDYVFSVVYRTDEDNMVYIAADDALYMPLNVYSGSSFSDMTDNLSGGFVDSNVTDFFDDDNALSNISVLGSITDKNNTGRYYLMVSTDTSSLYEQRSEILGTIVIFSILAILLLTLIIVLSSLNTMRVVKKASKAVQEISGGNLSARVNYKSKDELGQICSDVNEMGKNLETLFEEKDRTEKFYYKFVPEKFRELLGKENFTDLELGDAKSCELTVLFCDIRGFSINSEMMTAKENFAFANIIYGKMGPIVRNNNGFVDKYIGDAVMGLFEKPDDAVRCGIELYKTIVLDPKTAEELNVSDINIGIGVHTGMAMVGIVGESERLSGTVISETVNMSSRLESLTKQYKTAMLVSKSTIDRMSDPDSLDLRYLGIVQVAGVNEVEALYEVLDCLSDDMRQKRSSNSRELREAIRLFAMGRRDEAAASLQQIKDAGRDDYVTDLYLDYIRGMSEDDKGNVFRFVRK